MIEIETANNISSIVECPPSKSYTNRALIIAALADGEVTLERPLFSSDTHYMQKALRKFGVSVIQSENSLTVHGRRIASISNCVRKTTKPSQF